MGLERGWGGRSRNRDVGGRDELVGFEAVVRGGGCLDGGFTPASGKPLWPVWDVCLNNIGSGLFFEVSATLSLFS